jgi:hypothetical protein
MLQDNYMIHHPLEVCDVYLKSNATEHTFRHRNTIRIHKIVMWD